MVELKGDWNEDMVDLDCILRCICMGMAGIFYTTIMLARVKAFQWTVTKDSVETNYF